MNSLLEFIQSEMQPAEDKARLSDLVLARREMPDARLASTGAVPDCIFSEDGDILPDRLVVLAWIQMRREKPDLTQDQVMEMVNIGEASKLMEFLKRIYWFWSDLDRDSFEQRWTLRLQGSESELTPLETKPEEVEDENPTPSPNS